MSTLAYEVSSSRGASAGDILFLHGFMGRASDWQSIMAGFDVRYRCIAADLPGHGSSLGLPEGSYTMEGTAYAVLRLLDELDLHKPTLVGYSMGGRLALYLALRHPERCAGLFLESASPGLETEAERKDRRLSDEKLAKRLESEDFEEFLESWYRQPLFASLSRHEGLVEGLIAKRRDNDSGELVRSLRGMGTGSQPSLWKELENLSVPTLAVAGRFDGKFVHIAQEMAERNPRISVEVIPYAGHNVLLEAPEAYLLSVRRSISRAGGG